MTEKCSLGFKIRRGRRSWSSLKPRLRINWFSNINPCGYAGVGNGSHTKMVTLYLMFEQLVRTLLSILRHLVTLMTLKSKLNK